MTIDNNAGSLTENLIALIEASGGSRPASKGLSELYQALAVALSTGGGGGGAVDSVANTDGTLTISPTTGHVVASLAQSAVHSVVAGSNVTVNDTDPLNPIVSATGGGSSTPYNIIDPVVYAPSTPASGSGYSPTTAWAVVDGTHLSATFTGPASGSVRITASIFVDITVTGTQSGTLTLAFVTHGTTTLVTPREIVKAVDFGASTSFITTGRVTYDSGPITVVEGTSYHWDLAALAATNSTVNLSADDGLTSTNDFGPAIISVFNPGA